MRTAMDKIRNFSIIAHIDHGKSTLADRILEITGAVDPRDMRSQLLDSMDLERERGITIKAQAVRVEYAAADGETYHLHLIDTPGHVDFSYEVSRSLAACEGALLVVDAAQGVEAQTVANTYAAIDAGLELIPILNKVDLPGAEPGAGRRRRSPTCSAPIPTTRSRSRRRPGWGSTEVLEAIVARVPPPGGRRPTRPPRALIFDSEFDQYRGVVAYIRMIDGGIRKHDKIRAMQNGTEAEIDDLGYFRPQMTAVAEDGRGRGRLRDHRPQGRRQAPGRRHADLARRPGRPSRSRATARSSRSSSAASSRSTPTATRTSARRSRSSPSTTPP